MNKKEQLEFIITQLNSLEFTDKDEIKAVNYVNQILKMRIKNLDKTRDNPLLEQYIKNCPVNKMCKNCYREVVCKSEYE